MLFFNEQRTYFGGIADRCFVRCMERHGFYRHQKWGIYQI